MLVLHASTPDCPPGTPALPAPAVRIDGLAAPLPPVAAGRPFRITYDVPAGVAVADTLGPDGAPLAPGAAGALTASVPATGSAVFTVRYQDAAAAPGAACLQLLPFAVTVETGDTVPAGVGYTIGPLASGYPLRRLARRGDLLTRPPLVGVAWTCTATSALLPVVAQLRAERDLRRPPSARSAVTRLEVADPCDGRDARAAAPGALLRFSGGGAAADEGPRTLAVEHRGARAGRYSLRITQGGRAVGALRYYVASRRGPLGGPRLWVLAPEAAFARARCRPPRPSAPLGARPFPIPGCPRR